MPEPTQFAEWLNATMQRRGLSQAEVAREVGVADVQVSRWRRGQVRPTVHYLQRIADTFGVPRIQLDQLAGYPAEGEAVEDPQRVAALQACQDRFRRVLESLPPELWPAFTEACAVLAERFSASFGEAAGSLEAEVARQNERRRIGFRCESGG